MKALIPHLIFNGHCAETMQFYQKCLGGQLFMLPFAKSPIPELRAGEDKIMHAHLESEKFQLRAADTMPGHLFEPGNDFQLFVDCETLEETEQLFASLSQNGLVVMQLQDVFWGARFGALKDQFGIQWNLNCTKEATAKE